MARGVSIAFNLVAALLISTHAQGSLTPSPTAGACSFESVLACGASTPVSTLAQHGDFLPSFPGSEANYRLEVPSGSGLRLTVTSCLADTSIQAAVHLYEGRRPPGCPAAWAAAPVLLATSNPDFFCGTLVYDYDFRLHNATDNLILVVKRLKP
jgi:hypothetical protein